MLINRVLSISSWLYYLTNIYSSFRQFQWGWSPPLKSHFLPYVGNILLYEERYLIAESQFFVSFIYPQSLPPSWFLPPFL